MFSSSSSKKKKIFGACADSVYQALFSAYAKEPGDEAKSEGPSIGWRQTTKTRRLSLLLKRKGRSEEPLQEEEMNRVCEGFTPDMLATTPPLSSSHFKLHDWSSGRADCPSVLLENPVAESLLSLCGLWY